MKCVWLNTETGQMSEEFSDGGEIENDFIDAADEWKCIKYECLNDSSFSLKDMITIAMKKRLEK